MDRKFVVVGIILIFSGIILGAFGAHGLKKILEEFPEKIASFETGVRYQMYSGFAFLILGLNSDKLIFSLKPIFAFWIIGPITPLGGLLLILGWIILLMKFILKNR